MSIATVIVISAVLHLISLAIIAALMIKPRETRVQEPPATPPKGTATPCADCIAEHHWEAAVKKNQIPK